MSAEITDLCRNSLCRVRETGKCVEGFAQLSACPHTQVLASAASGSSGEIAQPALLGSESFLNVADGRSLSVGDASAVMASEPSRVVAIVGPSDSGKTSLVARMYDAFQWGACNDMQFCGSKTLSAFEINCHKARAASHRRTGAVDHTPAGQGVRFFHMRVLPKDSVAPLSLLLADRPGEDFRSVTDQSAAVDSFLEVRRADSLLLLVDGRRLCSPDERHNVSTELQLLVRAMVERGALSSRTELAVVLTKFDLVSAHRERAALLARFQHTVERIRGLTEALGGSVAQYMVAAMPETDVVATGYGVSDLLSSLCKLRQPPRLVRLNLTQSTRPFLKLVPVEG